MQETEKQETEKLLHIIYSFPRKHRTKNKKNTNSKNAVVEYSVIHTNNIVGITKIPYLYSILCTDTREMCSVQLSREATR